VHPWQRLLRHTRGGARSRPGRHPLRRHVRGCYNRLVTNDIEFLASYGAELLIEIARFFSSLAVFNPDRGRYEMHGVIGPDEYHDAYPGAVQPGIDNNGYTNIMVVWLMRRAADALAALRGYRCDELVAELAVDAAETARWSDISSKMFVPFHDGVISQFEGYERLIELDWEAYRARYANIGRLDLILEAEGDTPNRHKLSKQADTLMWLSLHMTGRQVRIHAPACSAARIRVAWRGGWSKCDLTKRTSSNCRRRDAEGVWASASNFSRFSSSLGFARSRRQPGARWLHPTIYVERMRRDGGIHFFNAYRRQRARPAVVGLIGWGVSALPQEPVPVGPVEPAESDVSASGWRTVQ
jgi:hypothetical protein